MKLLLSAAGQLDGRVGGGQIYVQKLAIELTRRGHDVVVVSAEAWAGGSGAFSINWRDWNEIQVAGLAINPDSERAGERWSQRSRSLRTALNHLLDGLRPELIHMNGIKPALVTVAKERAIPHVVTAHHPGVACPVGTLLRPDDSICQRPLDPSGCADCYCRQLAGGGPMGAALAALPAAFYRRLGRALNVLPDATYLGRTLMYPWLVGQGVEGRRFALQNAQRWIAPSQAIANVLERNGAVRESITIIPHGIEPLQRSPIEGLGRRPVRFGYIGQINRPKGLHTLFAAFGRLPHAVAELHLIGRPQSAKEKKYLETALEPCAGRADVRLRGAVPHDRIGSVLEEIDILILPAIYLEVFGLVVLEAFSAGRPVIISDCGGPAEIVRDGVDGIVFPRSDTSALEQAMRDLIGRPDRILKMADQIRPVRTLAEHVSDVEAVYDDVRSNHPAVPVMA